jgi:hypothetical protein
MACKLLEREEVPPPPRRAFEGVVDDGAHRWRFKQGLLTIYIRYEEKPRPGQLPWAAMWSQVDARR